MTRKTPSSSVAAWAVPRLVAAYVGFVNRTTRWERSGDARFQRLIEDGEPFICAMWHSRLLLMPVLAPEMGRPVVAMVSANKDGELLSGVLKRLGVDAARGSSADPRKPEKDKRGAAALRTLVKAARGGSHLALTPDGPRGPRQRVQPGLAQLARLTGLTVLPMTWAVSPARTLSTWDRFVVPLPFGRGLIAFGEPLTIEGESGGGFGAFGARVEDELNRVTARADAWAGRPASLPEAA